MEKEHKRKLAREEGERIDLRRSSELFIAAGRLQLFVLVFNLACSIYKEKNTQIGRCSGRVKFEIFEELNKSVHWLYVGRVFFTLLSALVWFIVRALFYEH